jgi:short-subunit dehydrogenase
MDSYVMITGAAGGLGKAFAAECAMRGWNLFLTDVSQPALEAAATGLKRMYGVTVETYTCDLIDAQARDALWKHVARRGLRFHMLCNVAGVDYQGPFVQRRLNELQTIVRLNIEATVEMTRRMLAFKHPAHRLLIVNVSSLAAFYPMPVKAVYAASKRFLLDWSLALNEELRPQGVMVTALCPAGMPTNDACIRAINAQGFAGRITTMNVGDVTRLTINRALAGQTVVVPGVVNQLLRALGSLAPPPLAAALINHRWQKAHQKSDGSGHVPPLTPSVGTPA